jgi:hypothetical protein
MYLLKKNGNNKAVDNHNNDCPDGVYQFEEREAMRNGSVDWIKVALESVRVKSFSHHE